jgi:antitoxin VapB
MAMNIKSEDTTALVRELAALTGESLTTAVNVAVAERLNHLRGDRSARAERLLAMGRDVASRLPEPYRSGDPDDLLYGEDGLPQ